MTTKQAYELIQKKIPVTTGMQSCLTAMDPTGEKEFTQEEIAAAFRRRIEDYNKKHFATNQLSRALIILEGREIDQDDYIIVVTYNPKYQMPLAYLGQWKIGECYLHAELDIAKARRYRTRTGAEWLLGFLQNEFKNNIEGKTATFSIGRTPRKATR